MRFSQQRTSMGGSPEAEAGVAAPDAQHPTQKLVATPRVEVDTLCRLALLRYLEGLGTDLARSAAAHLDVRAGESQPDAPVDPGVWRRLKVVLDSITVVDPACGAGHMLLGMLDLLDCLLQHADEVLGLQRASEARRRAIIQTNLYGVEAQLGTLLHAHRRLEYAVRESDSDAGCTVTPHLIQADSLVERDGFRWAERFDSTMRAGGFDLVLGNPPYVRHEMIADPMNRLPADEYKQEVFAAVQARLNTYLDGLFGEAAPAVTLSRRSDLSLLFTVSGLTLLQPGGVLGFVLPNAVSSARYGEPLRRLLHVADFNGRIVENLSRRSFTDVAVNTVLLLVRRQTQNNTTSTSRRADTRHAASAQDLPVATCHDEVTPGLNNLLSRIGERCTTLRSMGHLRYPIKTGLNCFFYPDAATRARFEIEPAFLIPVVKSPRDVRTLTITHNDLPTLLFHCSHSPEYLQQEGATGALSYIAWGAAQTRLIRDSGDQAVLPWPCGPSLRGRHPWYALPLPDSAQLLCPRFLHRRFFFALPEPGILEDQTFYGLELAPDWHRHRLLIGALLNSSLSYLMMEVHGRTGLGDGVRQYALHDMATLPVPDIAHIRAAFTPELTRAFEHLAARPILPIEQEVLETDRVELDTLVCAALGMSKADAMNARQCLTDLVSRRLHRAQRR